jgi:hypothetical protein
MFVVLDKEVSERQCMIVSLLKEGNQTPFVSERDIHAVVCDQSEHDGAWEQGRQ